MSINKKSVSKFPKEFSTNTVLDVMSLHPNLNFTLNILLEAFEKRIKAAEFVLKSNIEERGDVKIAQVFVRATTSRQPRSRRERSPGLNRSQKHDRSKSYENERKKEYNQRRSRDRIYCVFCEVDAHSSSECQVYPNYTMWRERIAKLQRCYKCLDRQHEARECNKPEAKCFRCRQVGHPTPLCPEQVHANYNNRSRSRSQSKNRTLKKTRFVEEGTGQYRVILETFICKVASIIDEDGAVEVRGILDSGSDHSCVTQEIVQKLTCSVLDLCKSNLWK